jgi:DNA polymerase
VGLSAKLSNGRLDRPLSPATPSGRLVQRIIDQSPGLPAGRTNLVKCPPLGPTGKTRPPTAEEINSCLPQLALEVEALVPRLVILLGAAVAGSMERHLGVGLPRWDGFRYGSVRSGGVSYAAVQHPSYIRVYKRKLEDEYVAGVTGLIQNLAAG